MNCLFQYWLNSFSEVQYETLVHMDTYQTVQSCNMRLTLGCFGSIDSSVADTAGATTRSVLVGLSSSKTERHFIQIVLILMTCFMQPKKCLKFIFSFLQKQGNETKYILNTWVYDVFDFFPFGCFHFCRSRRNQTQDHYKITLWLLTTQYSALKSFLQTTHRTGESYTRC